MKFDLEKAIEIIIETEADKFANRDKQAEINRQKSEEEFQKKVQKNIKKDDKINKNYPVPEEEKITAILAFKNNIEIIQHVLWGYLQPRRKKLDDIFYKALKNNNLYKFDLDEDKSITYRSDVAKGLANQRNKVNQKNQQNQQSTVTKNSKEQKDFKQAEEFAKSISGISEQNIFQSFEEYLFEAGILKTIGQSLLGQKPTVQTEIINNAKLTYNNLVLIMIIEFYLSNILKSFEKNIGIRGYRNEEDDFEDYENTTMINGIPVTYINRFFQALVGTQANDKNIRNSSLNKIQKLKNRFPGIDEAAKELYPDEINKYLDVASVVNNISSKEILSEGILKFIKNLLTTKFKMVNFTDMDKEKFIRFTNYLFGNKQFFIQMTKELHNYMSRSTNHYSIGTRFYNDLIRFNSLSHKRKMTLINDSFEFSKSNFNKLFSQLDKLVEILANTIIIEAKKEIDRSMGKAYQAGLKLGQFVGRMMSGQGNIRPINQQDSNQ